MADHEDGVAVVPGQGGVGDDYVHIVPEPAGVALLFQGLVALAGRVGPVGGFVEVFAVIAGLAAQRAGQRQLFEAVQCFDDCIWRRGVVREYGRGLQQRVHDQEVGPAFHVVDDGVQPWVGVVVHVRFLLSWCLWFSIFGAPSRPCGGLVSRQRGAGTGSRSSSTMKQSLS